MNRAIFDPIQTATKSTPMALPDQDKREVFAREYAASGNATYAAKKAGVPGNSAHSMGYKWLHNPAVCSMIRHEIDLRLRELTPIATNVIHDLMLDPKTPPQTRLAAARDILDRMGWVPPKRSEMEKEITGRTLQELSRDELENLASRCL